ncbi:Minor tail protein [Caenorhabditis elegans]|uniref:Minor tail protein n=1 Tax=Caenorhabditis elegans TaxID=6239 RepID=A0A8S4QBU0_CAEEL|nr:Minor tail protein [Caenorhabditis elegans]CAH2176087.1 Minor tail protein [Caenorhabditis elegans]
MPRGIVLTNSKPVEGMVYQMALVFDQNYETVKQFKMIPVVTQRTKTKQVSNVYSGNMRLEKSMQIDETLVFGQTIDWEPTDDEGMSVEIVRKYKRIRPAYESRIFDGETQLLLPGIMSRNREVLWMCDIWPQLEIKNDLKHVVHPNVAVNAWVTLHIRDDQSIKYELYSFDSTADSLQHQVRNASWNKEVEGNFPHFWDPVDENRVKNPDFVAPMADFLSGMRGYVMSDRIVLAEDPRHRDVCFHRIVLRESDGFPEPGSFIRFDAEKIDFLNIYAMKGIVNLNDQRALPRTANGNIKTTIRLHNDSPGFYYSEALQCFMDDPNNVLEHWLLSKYSNSTLQVGISAGEPSAIGTPRFVIAEITDAKARKLQALTEAGDIKFVAEPAIVINFRGVLYVPRLPKSVFRLRSSDMPIPPGTRIFITAHYENRWIIDKIDVDRRDTSVEALVCHDAKSGKEMRISPIELQPRSPDFPVLTSFIEDHNFIEENTLNNVGVPPVYGETAVAEYQEALRAPRAHANIIRMINDLEDSLNWARNPSKTIKLEIDEHLDRCDTCTNRDLNPNCYFPEYLSHALRQKPEIVEIFSPGMLSIITCRRFGGGGGV